MINEVFVVCIADDDCDCYNDVFFGYVEGATSYIDSYIEDYEQDPEIQDMEDLYTYKFEYNNDTKRWANKQGITIWYERHMVR